MPIFFYLFISLTLSAANYDRPAPTNLSLNYEQASFALLYELADQKCAPACQELSSRFAQGRGCTRNLANALYYSLIADGTITDIYQYTPLQPAILPARATVVEHPSIELSYLAKLESEPETISRQADQNYLNELLKKAKEAWKKKKRGAAATSYSEYFQICDKCDIAKDPQALCQYGRLCDRGISAVGEKNDARFYWQQAKIQGHRESFIEYARSLIAEGAEPGLSLGLNELTAFPDSDLEVDDALARAYLQKAFAVDEKSGPRVYRSLLRLHKAHQDYRAIKEYVSWTIHGKPGVSPDPNLKNLLEKLKPEDKKLAYKDIALRHEGLKQYQKACESWQSLASMSKDDNDDYFIDATAHLVYHFTKDLCTTDTETGLLWLENYYANRDRIKDPKTENNVLADALYSMATMAFHTQLKTQGQIIDILEKAHGLGHVKATNNYLALLFEAGQIDLALEVLEKVLPLSPIGATQSLVEQGKTELSSGKEYRDIALTVAEAFTPEKPQTEIDNDYFGDYLSFAALHGDQKAIVSLATCLMMGVNGFKMNQVLALAWLEKIPPESEFYPARLVMIGKYNLERQQYQVAVTLFLQALRSDHIGAAHLQSIEYATDKLNELNLFSHAATIYDEMIKMADRFPKENSSIKNAKYVRAIYGHKKYEGAPLLSSTEIISLLDESGLSDAMLLKGRILIDQGHYRQAEVVLTAAAKLPKESEDFYIVIYGLLGKCYQLSGDFQKASSALSKAAELGSTVAMLNLAVFDLFYEPSIGKTLRATLSIHSIFVLPEESYQKTLASPERTPLFFLATKNNNTYKSVAETWAAITKRELPLKLLLNVGLQELDTELQRINTLLQGQEDSRRRELGKPDKNKHLLEALHVNIKKNHETKKDIETAKRLLEEN
ncbi:MAG TPA: hypothetical protein VEL47_03070 [Myxococcota bacterium]|nr:hypothetical protein [Myxococcota bacterium]